MITFPNFRDISNAALMFGKNHFLLTAQFDSFMTTYTIPHHKTHCFQENMSLMKQ